MDNGADRAIGIIPQKFRASLLAALATGVEFTGDGDEEEMGLVLISEERFAHVGADAQGLDVYYPGMNVAR